MNNNNDIERINRANFRSCLEAFARPGQNQEIGSLFNSKLQAMASVLLYSEVSYCYRGQEDFQMIQAICGAKSSTMETADYLFFDHPDSDFLFHAKVGTAEQPELGATLIFKCHKIETEGTSVQLSGPGIDTTLVTTLPVNKGFIQQLNAKNESFPMGVDIFFLSESGILLGLPRTTKIEVMP